MNSTPTLNNNTQASFLTNELTLPNSMQWDETLQQLRTMKEQKLPFDAEILANLRRTIECDGAPLSVQEQLITMYPKELAFSIFLSVTRFPVHSDNLMNDIFAGIKEESEANMDYCITKFQGDPTTEKSDHTVIGEALTLSFSFFDDFNATPQSGNLEALQKVKGEYPKSILYANARELTPLHGVCCALNMEIFKFFIYWHLEQKPLGRGGLYETNDSGITSLDTLIETQTNIVPTLQWLRNHTLLKSGDVALCLLIHRAAFSSSISTLEFFLDLYPSGVLAEDDDGNLPIRLHLVLRPWYVPRNTFSEEDFAITKLLIKYGLKHNIDTIGGLFHKKTDEVCTLMILLEEVGVNNTDKVWSMIRSCLDEAGEYSNAPIMHAAISNKKIIPNGLFKEIVDQFGVMNRNEHGVLPLQHALRMGLEWVDGVSDIFKADTSAIYEIKYENDFENADLNSIYEILSQRPSDFILILVD